MNIPTIPKFLAISDADSLLDWLTEDTDGDLGTVACVGVDSSKTPFVAEAEIGDDGDVEASVAGSARTFPAYELAYPVWVLTFPPHDQEDDK